MERRKIDITASRICRPAFPQLLVADSFERDLPLQGSRNKKPGSEGLRLSLQQTMQKPCPTGLGISTLPAVLYPIDHHLNAKTAEACVPVPCSCRRSVGACYKKVTALLRTIRALPKLLGGLGFTLTPNNLAFSGLV